MNHLCLHFLHSCLSGICRTEQTISLNLQPPEVMNMWLLLVIFKQYPANRSWEYLKLSGRSCYLDLTPNSWKLRELTIRSWELKDWPLTPYYQYVYSPFYYIYISCIADRRICLSLKSAFSERSHPVFSWLLSVLFIG